MLHTILACTKRNILVAYLARPSEEHIPLKKVEFVDKVDDLLDQIYPHQYHDA